MIVKENHNPVPTDKFEKAGYDAERKVAYYLRMAFDDNPNLLILNDLRVEFEDGITAQMDHLVIHQYGLIIIESKSVAGKLQVKEDGQWLRWYNNHSSGLQNPIKQAQLQGQTLKRKLLNSSKEDTRKVLENFPIDVLVSISDSGVFIAHERALYPEVCKADQVDEQIKFLVLNRAKDSKPSDFMLSDINKTKLAEHLVKNHKPYEKHIKVLDKPYKPSLADTPVKVEQKVSEYIVTNKPKPISVISAITEAISSTFSVPETKFKHNCHKCKSNKYEILSGKFGYYTKCADCNENTKIKITCHDCENLLKIRKDEKRFFADCDSCKTRDLFHINH